MYDVTYNLLFEREREIRAPEKVICKSGTDRAR